MKKILLLLMFCISSMTLMTASNSAGVALPTVELVWNISSGGYVNVVDTNKDDDDAIIIGNLRGSGFADVSMDPENFILDPVPDTGYKTGIYYPTTYVDSNGTTIVISCQFLPD